MHLLPQLGKLEAEYPDELVVIGVHSAKFPAERAGGSLRSAVQRFQLEHPVVNDRDFRIWQEYGVRAWPTLMFIDPNGYVIGKHEGEVPAGVLLDTGLDLITRFEAADLIDRRPVDALAPLEFPTEQLAFPGKILADADSERLFIADTGHNRIIVASLDGDVQKVIGGVRAGFADGSFSGCRFREPRGVALKGDRLYIADTGNGAVRIADLQTETVGTIAGTGQQGLGVPEPGSALEVQLRSPWDLALSGTNLYIAMAGTHQLWRLDLGSGWIEPYAGNGVESIRDGQRENAWLAQPSGLALTDRVLYFADSESSAIRGVDLPPGMEVQTLIGTGLFDYGDVDGVGDSARLQHPIGLAFADGVLYVADSYNHKIKRLYPAERRVESWLGDGEHGFADGALGEARFDEPSGLSIAGDQLYIADTNNHAIRVVELKTGVVTTLGIRGLE